MRLLKEIKYQDQLCFRIPSDWTEHFHQDQGGMYFQDAPSTGILRLSLIGYKNERKFSKEELFDYLISSSAEENIIEDAIEISDGSFLIRFVQNCYDEDGKITLYWWKFVNNSIADLFQVAMFSFTVVDEDLHKQLIKDELQLLVQELRSVRFLEMR